MLLEICANSYLSAKNAKIAGAQRIELCQELAVGGITPSYGLIKKVIQQVKLPCFVLIRPRSGDFVYSDAEFDVMKEDIVASKDLGVHGIVSGVLNKDNTIDTARTKELVELARPLPFTFHRSFDELNNPVQGLHELMELGVNRVLTSGQQSTAENGLALISELNELAKGRITILPGGGIHSDNVVLFKNKGFTEIHASASVRVEQKVGLFSSTQTISDQQKIKNILNAL